MALPKGADEGTASNMEGKGKATPVHAWIDPEGWRRLRLPDFKTIGMKLVRL